MFDVMRRARTEDFWSEIAPPEHLVQFYGNDETFLDTLEGFIIGGLRKGESVIVIVTPRHAQALEIRLNRFWIEAEQLRRQYICVDAEQTLAKFMVNNWPDENLFLATVNELLQGARKDGRAVRAFGEMVALMWAKGLNSATVRLEHLWHNLCESESFSLFCAYPKSGFTKDAEASIQEISIAHSKVFSGITNAASI